MADFVQCLVDMGFAKDKAEKAVQVTENRGVEPAMEWILSNADSDQPGTSKAVSETPSETGVSNDSKGEEKAEEKADSEASVRSYKCEDCGKLFKDVEAVEFHAAKTNHSNFSESTEEKKPLSPEEKAEQMKLLEEKLKQKRKEREEREKLEDLDREKSRVAMGKELAEAKRRLAEQEMKEIVEARRKEKIDDRLARERVKAKIEEDKLARKAKLAQQQGIAPPTLPTPPPTPVVAASDSAVSPPKKDYKETKLQLRLPSGKTLIQTFGVSEPLAAVRLYIELNRDDGTQGTFNLMTSFPRKVYQGDDYDMPLEALGLVPSAVLMVTKSA